jgi:hypothetical protein
MSYKFNPFTGKLDVVTPSITELSELSGENISATPTAGDIVGFDGATWVNRPPAVVSAGAGVNLFPTQDPSDLYATTGYLYAQLAPTDSIYVDLFATCNNNKLEIVNYITDALIDTSKFEAGIWTSYFWGYASIAGHSQVVFDHYERTVGGVETLLFSMASIDIAIASTQYVVTSLQPQYVLAAGSRLVVKVCGQTTNTSNTDIHAVGGDADHADYVNVPLAVHYSRLYRTVASLVAQALPGSSSYTWSIPLPDASYTNGSLIMHIPNTAPYGTVRRNVGYYKFGTAVNDAYGFGPDVTGYLVSLCVFNDRWQSGYAYIADSKLSSSFFGSGATYVAYLKSIRINGANLELIFTNGTIVATSLSFRICIDVWK